jgi:hypothetical protein
LIYRQRLRPPRSYLTAPKQAREEQLRGAVPGLREHSLDIPIAVRRVSSLQYFPDLSFDLLVRCSSHPPTRTPCRKKTCIAGVSTTISCENERRTGLQPFRNGSENSPLRGAPLQMVQYPD